jgi:hypothetical protein
VRREAFMQQHNRGSWSFLRLDKSFCGDLVPWEQRGSAQRRLAFEADLPKADRQ